MPLVKVSGPAEPKIDRHEHQSRSVPNRHGEGQKPELRRSYPRQRPRMAPVCEPVNSKCDDQEARAIRISTRHSTRLTSSEKGRITNSIASR